MVVSRWRRDSLVSIVLTAVRTSVHFFSFKEKAQEFGPVTSSPERRLKLGLNEIVFSVLSGFIQIMNTHDAGVCVLKMKHGTSPHVVGVYFVCNFVDYPSFLWA